MALTREYYYEKYVLIDEWVENEPAEYIEQKVIKTDEVLYEASPNEDYLWFDFSSIPASRISEVNLDFAVVPDGDNGFKLELAGEHPEIPYPRDCDLAFNFETGYRYFYGYSAYRYFDHPTPVYAITDGIFTEYRTTYFDVADTRADSFTWCKWGIFEIEFDAVYRMTLKEKQMYRIQERGEYIETIIAAEGAYPLDGAQDGFWWVRKAEYTLEPPELNYPEPIAEMTIQLIDLSLLLYQEKLMILAIIKQDYVLVFGLIFKYNYFQLIQEIHLMAGFIIQVLLGNHFQQAV